MKEQKPITAAVIPTSKGSKRRIALEAGVVDEQDAIGCGLEILAYQGAPVHFLILDGQDLTGLNLDGLHLRGASLVGANLAGSSLRGARLEDCDLSRATLAAVDATEATFTGCNLFDAMLSRNDVKAGCFVASDFSEARMAAA